MPLTVHVSNAHSSAIRVKYGGDKILVTSEKKGGGAGIGIGGIAEVKGSGNIARKYDIKSIGEIGFTEIGPGNDMDFSTSTVNSYLTIRMENEKELCVNKEIIKSSNYIVDSKGQLLSAQKGTKYWIDKDGNYLKPKYKNINNQDLAPNPYSGEEGARWYSLDDTESKNGIEMKERRILVIGKTGVGKSTTANTILGRKEFECSLSAKSVTKKSTLATSNRFGRKLVIVDTPGLCDTDTKISDEEVIEEVKKFYGMTAPGLHAVLLVVKIDRFGEEEEKTINLFIKHFGKELLSYLIVVFAGKDTLEVQDIDIKDYIRTFEDTSSMRTLLDDINHRHMVFGIRNKHSSDNIDRAAEVKELLDMMDKVVESNGQRFFTNKSYQDAENLIKKEIEIRGKQRHPSLYQNLHSFLEKTLLLDASKRRVEAEEERRKLKEADEEKRKQQDAFTERRKQNETREETRKQQEACAKGNPGVWVELEKAEIKLRTEVRNDIQIFGSSCVII